MIKTRTLYHWLIPVLALTLLAGWSVAQERPQRPTAATASSQPAGADLIPLTHADKFHELGGVRHPLGLYGGTNEMPEAHRKAGEEIARTIVPLDAQGKPDPANGKIRMAGIGHSIAVATFGGLRGQLQAAQQAGNVNPAVQFNSYAGQGMILFQIGQTEDREGGKLWVDLAKNGKLPFAGPQTQVLLVMTTWHRAPRQRIEDPFDALPLKERNEIVKKHLTILAQESLRQCPNLEVILLANHMFGGYRGREPMFYEEAFAIRATIQAQIDGDPELAFQGANRKAPYLAWGAYVWDPTWPRDYFGRDGVHTAREGTTVMAAKWLETLKTNPATAKWVTDVSAATAQPAAPARRRGERRREPRNAE